MTTGRQRVRAADTPVSSRFGWLLLLLVLDYLISAFLSEMWVSAVRIALFAMVVALATWTADLARRIVYTAITLLFAGSATTLALAATYPRDVVLGVANVWTAVILIFAVVQVLRRVLTQRSVTLDSIFGAVSAYMMIGLMFAALYNAMNRLDGGGFFAHHMVGDVKTFQYFSFTTLTTLGYGDFTAANSDGRAVAVLEAVLGQVFLATLVAKIVSAFQPRGWGAAHAAAPERGRRHRPRTARQQPAARSGTASRARAWPARRSRSRRGR